MGALNRRVSNIFFAEVSCAMNEQSSLSEQLGAFSEILITPIHPESGGVVIDPSAIAHMLADQTVHTPSREPLRKSAPISRKPVCEGETRVDLDVDDASEWLARILLSFTIFQASTAHEGDNPQRYANSSRDTQSAGSPSSWVQWNSQASAMPRASADA